MGRVLGQAGASKSWSGTRRWRHRHRRLSRVLPSSSPARQSIRCPWPPRAGAGGPRLCPRGSPHSRNKETSNVIPRLATGAAVSQSCLATASRLRAPHGGGCASFEIAGCANVCMSSAVRHVRSRSRRSAARSVSPQFQDVPGPGHVPPWLCEVSLPHSGSSTPMRRTFRYLAHVPSSRRRCCHDGPWEVLAPPLPAEEGAWALQEGDPALKRQSRESARAARSISERWSAQLGAVVVC